MIYDNGQLDQVLTENGYIDLSGSSPSYHDYLSDHLGNNRVVLSESGAVEQVNHYYPFGGLMAGSSGGEVQPWKFGGKELDRNKELNLSDFGSRQYNPDSKYYNNPSARIIDEYELTSNNCTTVVSDVLNRSGSKALKTSKIQQSSSFGTWTTVPIVKRFVVPVKMQNYMNRKSYNNSIIYKKR